MGETGSSAGVDVILCTPEGRPAGLAPKSEVHHADTPLHLAFSCYVFRADGQVLVTQRAFTKATWPGVVTNSCCGHPEPGEPLVAAVNRRLRQELGLEADRVDLILPEFRYRARMPDGTVENELCPVFRAIVSDTTVQLAPAEVHAAWWAPWPAFVHSGRDGDLSPWCAAQLIELEALGLSPLAWETGDARRLPAVATP